MDKRIFIILFAVFNLHERDRLTVEGNIFSGLVSLFSKSRYEKKDIGDLINRHKRITTDEGVKEKPLKTSNFHHPDEIKRRNVDTQLQEVEDGGTQGPQPQQHLHRKDLFRTMKRRNLLTTAFGSPDNITLIEQSAKLKSSSDKGDEYIDAEVLINEE